MQELVQSLRALDSKTFEHLCLQLFKARYPKADVRRVDGDAGDDGMDAFLGDLESGPTVWQCKAFGNGVKESQKGQIRASFYRALQRVKPKVWVLCLSVDLDAKCHRWWQDFAKKHRQTVDMRLISGSDIIEQLIFRRQIREAFFPKVIMDVASLRTLLSETKNLTAKDLLSLAVNDAAVLQDYLASKDPRFSYELVFSSDGNQLSRDDTTRPHLLATFATEETAVNVFARDIQALKEDPPKIAFEVGGDGVKKLTEHFRTGVPVEIGPRELVSFSSDLDFLLPESNNSMSERRLVITQSGHLPSFSFRVSFGIGTDCVAYQLLEFKTVRRGTEEAELLCTTPLPFEIRIIVQFKDSRAHTGAVDFRARLAGSLPHEIQKATQALVAFHESGYMELYNLKSDNVFSQIKVPRSVVQPWIAELREIADDLDVVGKFYHVQLKWPTNVSASDLETLYRLRCLIDGILLPDFSAVIEISKVVQLSEEYVSAVLAAPMFRLERINQQQVQVFGISVTPSPTEVILDRCEIENAGDFSSFLRHAPLGSSFTVKVKAPAGAIVKAMPRP